MDNITSLICKNCGGRMTHRSNALLFCDSCGSELLLNVSSEDFDIVAGKLNRYTGESTTVIVPDTVTTIGDNAFKDLAGLTSIILSSTVTRIENNAFLGCSNLQTVDIPASVNYIGDGAFKNSGLIALNIKGNLNYIGNEAFMGCSNLKEITIQGKVARSGLKVFKQCSQLHIVNMDLSMFAGSLKPSNEANKKGDNRPTFFDFFQATPFFTQLAGKRTSKKCFYCDGQVTGKGTCATCGEKHYEITGGCYVATCIYGSYDCPQVWTLRRYRDDTLGSTWYGRAFIRTYYTISPSLVKWFGDTRWFKKMWKGKLDRMVSKLQATGVENTPYEDKVW